MEQWLSWVLSAGAVALLAVVLHAVLRRSGPDPGDIWWAEIPFSDGTGAKLRPCLILHRTARGVVVLKITSQDKSHRRDHVVIPTRRWDPRAKHDSYLNLGEPILVSRKVFDHRAGRGDAKTLATVRARPTLQPRSLRNLRTPQTPRRQAR